MVMTEVHVHQIPFSYTLASGQGVRIAEYAPFDGFIKEVIVHWPDGCNGLVDVRIEHAGKQFLPNPDYGQRYLSLDAATPTFIFHEPLQGKHPITVEIGNADAANQHTVTVMIMVESLAGIEHVGAGVETVTSTFNYPTRGFGKPDYSTEVSAGRERRGLTLGYRQTLQTFAITFTAHINGTHTAAGSATVMTDSAALFTVDALIGSTIQNDTDGSSGVITDNDATTVTVAALTGGTLNTWSTGDAYTIPSPFAWVTTPLAVGATTNFIDTVTGLTLPYTIAEGYTLSLIAAAWGFTEDAIVWVYLDGLIVAGGGVMLGGQTEYENKIIGISSAIVDPTGANSHTADLQVTNLGGGALEGSVEWNLILEAVSTPPLPLIKVIRCKWCGYQETVPAEQTALICPKCSGLTRVNALRNFKQTV